MSGREDLCLRCEGDLIQITDTLLSCDTCGQMRKMSIARKNWWIIGKCSEPYLEHEHGEPVVNIFFPDEPAPLWKHRRAKKICGTCVVLPECRKEAIENDELYGIWGGLTRRERLLVTLEPDRPEKYCDHCGMNYLLKGIQRKNFNFCSDECRRGFFS